MEIKNIRNAFDHYTVDVKCSTMLPDEKWTTIRLPATFNAFRHEMNAATRKAVYSAHRNFWTSSRLQMVELHAPLCCVLTAIENWFHYPVAFHNHFEVEDYRFDKESRKLRPVCPTWYWGTLMCGTNNRISAPSAQSVESDLTSAWRDVMERVESSTFNSSSLSYCHITASEYITDVIAKITCTPVACSDRRIFKGHIFWSIFAELAEKWVQYVRIYSSRRTLDDDTQTCFHNGPMGEILLAHAAILATVASYHAGQLMFYCGAYRNVRRNPYMYHIAGALDMDAPHIGYLAEYAGVVGRFQGPSGTDAYSPSLTSAPVWYHPRIFEDIDAMLRVKSDQYRLADGLSPRGFLPSVHYLVKLDKESWMRYTVLSHRGRSDCSDAPELRTHWCQPALISGYTGDQMILTECETSIREAEHVAEVTVCIQHVF